MALHKVVTINAGSRKYPVEIGTDNLWETEFRRFGHRRAAIVTDSNVSQTVAFQTLEDMLRDYGLQPVVISFEAGEKSKTLATVDYIMGQLSRAKLDENTLLIAAGGGVVGDITGLAAYLYLRKKLDYVQVPTTLLAMTDSSIGGKTGFDVRGVKNIGGVIHQPLAVIVDTIFLETLPKQQILYGMAEPLKMAMTMDADFFSYLEMAAEFDNAFYVEVIRRSAQLKGHIVELDEQDSGERHILNYGHTIGQALEALHSYRMHHGAADYFGMQREGLLSCLSGHFPRQDLERQNNLIRKLGFSREYHPNLQRLYEKMRQDKKSINGEPQFIMPTGVGSVRREGGRVAFPAEKSLVMAALS